LHGSSYTLLLLLPVAGADLAANVPGVAVVHQAPDADDLSFYEPCGPHKLRHIFGGQIVRLNGDQYAVSSRQGVDDQRSEGRATVEEDVIVVLRLSLPQHFCEVSLRVNIDQQTFLSFLCQPRTEAEHGGALADAALLVGDGDHGCFLRHIDFSFPKI